jgi:hypothetical protein
MQVAVTKESGEHFCYKNVLILVSFPEQSLIVKYRKNTVQAQNIIRKPQGGYEPWFFRAEFVQKYFAIRRSHFFFF